MTSSTALSPDHERPYLPGMGADRLLGLYDPVTRLMGIPVAHEELVRQAAPPAGARVLELGCGTGNLTLLAARRHPDARVIGLDPDARALERARRKAERAGVSVRFERGFAGELPYGDATVDQVLSALMLHHLEPDERRRALAEVARVLRPGGSLHVVDFGGAISASDGLLAGRMRKVPRLRDNLDDRLPALMRAAGLADAEETGHRVRWFGRYTFWRAVRP
jgi:ubiquinone/menaquinone biosynthesis C-methylase UbiE